jgi:signal peptide peptidase SppA
MHITREPIFTGALRLFCATFAAILGAVLAIFLVFLVIGFSSSSDIVPEKSKLILTADAEGNRELLPHTAPVILRVDIHGIIGDDLLTYEDVDAILLDSRTGLLAGDRVRGILLHFNTPGGTVTDSDVIYRSLMAYKKRYDVPVYAYVEGICASGGVYISCAADKIYASSESIIGSVGAVIGPTFNFSEAMGKVGIASVTFTEGKDKDMLNPFRPWKEGEDKSIRTLLANSYEHFVSLVAAARPKLSRDKLVNEYGAQIFDAPTAQRLGYVDEGNSNYAQALTDLCAAAGIAEKEEYQVVQLLPTRSLFSELLLSKSPLVTGTVKHTFQLAPGVRSDFSGKLLYLYQPSPD